MKRIIPIFLLFFSGIAPSGAQPEYKFLKLTNEDGLSHNTVNEIVQDSSGVLWIASKHGLNKYDSYGFTRYFTETSPGLPSNTIESLLVDTQDNLYVGTPSGLARYERESDRFTALKWKGYGIGPVIALHETRGGRILAGCSQGCYAYCPVRDSMINLRSLSGHMVSDIVALDSMSYLFSTHSGLFIIDDRDSILQHFNTVNTPVLESNLLESLLLDSRGRIWVGTIDAGLFLLDPDHGQWSRVSLSGERLAGSEFVRTIREDHEGRIWVGTEAGLFISDRDSEQFVNIPHSLEESHRYLNDNAVYCLHLSREHIMWIGTYFGGINYAELGERKNFHHIYPGYDDNELRGKAVNRMVEDSRGMIWIATEDGGACALDRDSKKIGTCLQHRPGGGLSSNNIHAVCEDRNGDIWFGHFRTGIDIYNPLTGSIRHVFPNPDNTDEFDYNSVYKIFTDSKEGLWVGTRRNVRIYDYRSRSFRTFKPDEMSGYFIYDILEDRKGRLWFSTRSNGIICYYPDSDNLRHFNVANSEVRSNMVISSMEDRSGRIWFGTMEGGVNVFDPETEVFRVISTGEGLSNSTVYGILEDEEGYIWLSTISGLNRLDASTGEIKNYSLEDGLAQMQFNYGSYFKDSEGTLYFGSVGGLTYFNPAEIKSSIARPRVMLTDIKLFNSSLEIGEEGILKRPVDETGSIRLKHSQNVLTIDYVAINYFSPGNNHFSYYLEGFEADWNDAGNRTSVTYTNLSPGSYTFRLKAANTDGVESSNVKQLVIKVLRPWWYSNAALVFYTLFIALILFISRRMVLIREKERSVLKVEKLEKERIKQLNQQRIDFFTFISHEFKTPLSIIQASVDELSDAGKLNTDEGKRFDRIKRASKRLSFLVGQLMDFRRIETRHAKLVYQKGDVVGFVNDTCQAFQPIYASRNIRLEYSTSRDRFTCWFDPDKIEKILTNLLSNAVKYTPENGVISCDLMVREDDLVITVLNSGQAMKQEELEAAFSPFHMDSKKKKQYHGSGLGLTLVKSLAEYMDGNVEASSINGKGTSFTVTIPTRITTASNIVLDPGGIPEDRVVDIENHLGPLESEPQLEEQEDSHHGQHHILIVEDTLDLAGVLIQHYSGKFRVSFAKNGREALKIVKQAEPDLIISDIMMPEMNGLELCRAIKSDDATSHIAVILLTAKVSQEDKIEGLRAGAEAYVAKPFDFKELDLHVKHFIDIRKRIGQTLSVGQHLELDDIRIHDKDKGFIEEVTRIINENIGNETFTIEDLSTQLGMSKTLVYLKHKKLMNMSAKEYLQLLRFQKAIKYMTSGDYNISEIAYEVGFSDPNYFSRAFKKVYKVSPTEYKEQLIQDTVPGQDLY